MVECKIVIVSGRNLCSSRYRAQILTFSAVRLRYIFTFFTFCWIKCDQDGCTTEYGRIYIVLYVIPIPLRKVNIPLGNRVQFSSFIEQCIVDKRKIDGIY